MVQWEVMKGNERELKGNEREVTGGCDKLMLLPDDLLLYGVLVRIDHRVLLRLTATCSRFRMLAARAWEKLVLRDFQSVVVSGKGREAEYWKELYRDMCLENLEWIGMPKRAVSGTWPIGRWGHSLTAIDEGQLVMFGGESQDDTCSDVQVSPSVTVCFELFLQSSGGCQGGTCSSLIRSQESAYEMLCFCPASEHRARRLSTESMWYCALLV